MQISTVAPLRGGRYRLTWPGFCRRFWGRWKDQVLLFVLNGKVSTWSLFDTILSRLVPWDSERLDQMPTASFMVNGHPLWMLMMPIWQVVVHYPAGWRVSCFRAVSAHIGSLPDFEPFRATFGRSLLHMKFGNPHRTNSTNIIFLQLTVFFIAVGALKDEQLKIQALQSFTVLFGATLRDHDHGQRDGTHLETYVSCGTFRSTRHLDGCLLRISEKIPSMKTGRTPNPEISSSNHWFSGVFAVGFREG